MCHFRHNLKHGRRSAFTLVEVAVTIVVVGLIVGSAMSILDRIVGAMGDMRLRADAFELARQNMETLLSEATVQDKTEYGVSEIHPEIQWQTVIEPFYEPITNAMWVRAVCSAGFNDSKGQYQNIELEHWLTNLSAEVVRQIIQQQKAEEEYLDLLSGTSSGQEEAAIQETIIAYLTYAGLDVEAYKNFLARQRRQILDYIAKNGFDDGYLAFLEGLRQDAAVFLEKLGMDIEEYEIFARTYEPQSSSKGESIYWDNSNKQDIDTTPKTEIPTIDPGPKEQPTTTEPKKIWGPEDLPSGLPPSMVPWILKMLNEG